MSNEGLAPACDCVRTGIVRGTTQRLHHREGLTSGAGTIRLGRVTDRLHEGATTRLRADARGVIALRIGPTQICRRFSCKLSRRSGLGDERFGRLCSRSGRRSGRRWSCGLGVATRERKQRQRKEGP